MLGTNLNLPLFCSLHPNYHLKYISNTSTSLISTAITLAQVIFLPHLDYKNSILTGYPPFFCSSQPCSNFPNHYNQNDFKTQIKSRYWLT